MTDHLRYVRAMIENTTVYCPGDDSECMRVRVCYPDHFRAIGERTGDEYHINYSDVDLENDYLYRMVQINHPDSGFEVES